MDIINYSILWDLFDGMADGVVKYERPSDARIRPSVLDTIDAAVKAGVLWVNAAGNAHERTWHGTFQDTTNPRNYIHNYSDQDERNYITVKPGTSTIKVEMQWDDDWGGANCNLDLYLYSHPIGGTTSTAVDYSIDRQNGGLDDYPYEASSTVARSTEQYYISIKRQPHFGRGVDPCAGVDWVHILVQEPHILEHSRTGYSISPPATSRSPGILAVGAAPHYNVRTIQGYSGQGPTVDGRTEPDTVGTDCIQASHSYQDTTIPGTNTVRAGTKCWIWGTSQSAPHITGMAARILEKYDDPDNRQYGAVDVADWIKETAVQRITTEDPNDTWGYGFAYLPALPPTASLTAKPGTLNVTTSISPTLTATNVGTGVTVSVNRDGDIDAGVTADTGNLALDGNCPGETGANTSTTSGGTVQLKGCVPGAATVRLHKKDTKILLASYPVTVRSTATKSPSRVGSTTNQDVNLNESVTLDVSGKFNYEEWYTFSVTDDTIVEASMQNANLKLKGLKVGSTRVTVYASNGQGTVKQTWTARVRAPSSAPTASGTPANQTVNVNGTTTVDVSGDFSGTGISYSASSSDTTKATASILASSSIMAITGVAAGTATITVTATNSAGFVTQTYSVTVNAAPTTPTPGGPTVPTGGPSVNAGSDQTVSRGATVSLTGTGSPVDDDDDASYSWTQRSGTTVSLKNAVTPSLPYTSGLAGGSAKFTAPSTAGTLIFRLTVTDQGTSISSWDELAVTVQ